MITIRRTQARAKALGGEVHALSGHLHEWSSIKEAECLRRPTPHRPPRGMPFDWALREHFSHHRKVEEVPIPVASIQVNRVRRKRRPQTVDKRQRNAAEPLIVINSLQLLR